MTQPLVSIDSLYNGPVNCGNGGYISGLLAGLLNSENGSDAEIRINAAFPVETPLQVKNTDTGVGVYLDDKLLGSVRSIQLELVIPMPPDVASARAASERFDFMHYSAPQGCYVCSPNRDSESGLGVFCGALLHEHLNDEPLNNQPLNNGADAEPENIEQNIVAALWRPTANLCVADGTVDNIYVWSALDCPGAYAIKAAEPDAGVQLLGTCRGSIKAALSAGLDYIISSWKIAPNSGRKRFMGVAIHNTAGDLMACAEQIWFDVGSSLPTSPAQK